MWKQMSSNKSFKNKVANKLFAYKSYIYIYIYIYKNQLENSPKVTDKPIMKIINNQQDIKLGKFTQELNVILTKIKNRKAAGLDEILP